MQYSFAIGFRKGLVSASTVLLSLMVFAGFSDLQVWELFVLYVKPVVGSVTVGGLITIFINYVKITTEE